MWKMKLIYLAQTQVVAENQMEKLIIKTTVRASSKKNP